ncbi:MAG: UDP-N-acetylmuramate--L-alanine ligase [Actinobacteria bacterium]|nr:UDP-N-acetylmuramate--L-alanine ligase [Actinomycetota bacterium]
MSNGAAGLPLQTPLGGAERVHFIGIGGAGMSAVAKVLLERGRIVSGSDLKRSRAFTLLEALGADLRLGHRGSSVDGAGLVVVSSAIPPGNPELKRAGELGIPVITRGGALADILDGQRSIVVAGTHGKTTTTSMVVSILRSSGLDPTYLVGGGLNDAGSNARSGRGELAVAESDESDGSFLLLAPSIAIVTNVEADHLDYWGSLEAIRAGFETWLGRVVPGGSIVVPAADGWLRAAAARTGRRVITFGEGGDVCARDLEVEPDGTTTLSLACAGAAEGSGHSAPTHLRVPGLHNVANALAAVAGVMEAGLAIADAASGLAAYRGVERRFQIRGTSGGVTVVDDYAHHPTEVRASLAAAHNGPWRRIVAVFQPHRYSRAPLFGDFGTAFTDADRVVVTDVYGAGEAPVPGVTGKLVSDSASEHLPGRPIAYLPHRAEVVDYLVNSLRPGDLLLTMGAGDINTVGEELLGRLGAPE